MRGLAWSYGSLVGVRLLVLASTAVLARLLSPREFGLVALALIFTSVLDAVRDLGVNQALVVATDDEVGAQAQTAFSFTILIGAGLALVVAALSPLAAAFFDQPALLALLAVLGLNLPLRSLGLTHYALAQRRLDFRSRTISELVEVVARGGVGIALALAGRGAWSLVLGYLAGTLAWTCAVYALVDWRPSLRLRRSELAPLMGFGGALTVVGLIGVAMSYVDNLFVGRVLGPAALGVYVLGFRLSEMLIVDLMAAAGLVLFPAFALLDRPAIAGAVIAASRYAMLLGLPVAAAMFVLADPLVVAVFGRRWHDAVPVVRILSLGFVGWPLGQMAGNAYQATRRVDVMAKLAVPQGLLLVALLAIFVSHGLAAVAACQAGVRMLFVAIGVFVSTRVLALRARDLLDALWPALAATGGMVAAIVPVELAIGSPWPRLLAGCAVGGAAYCGLAWLLAGDAVRGLWTLVRGRGETVHGSEAAVIAAHPERAGSATA